MPKFPSLSGLVSPGGELIRDHNLHFLVQGYNWAYMFLGAFKFFFCLETICIYANYPLFA